MYFGNVFFFSPIKFNSVVLLLCTLQLELLRHHCGKSHCAAYTTVTTEVCDVTNSEHTYLSPTALFFFSFLTKKRGGKSAVDFLFFYELCFEILCVKQSPLSCIWQRNCCMNILADMDPLFCSAVFVKCSRDMATRDPAPAAWFPNQFSGMYRHHWI